MRKLTFAVLIVAAVLPSCTRRVTVVTGTRDGSPCAYEFWERRPARGWTITGKVDACPERDSAYLWHVDNEN